MYLEGKEFKSIWNAAHLWAGHDPESIDPNALPDEVRDYIHWLIVGHFRGELPLRGKWLVIDNRDESAFYGLLNVPIWLKLRRWKSRSMVDRYAKFVTENLMAAAARIENGQGGNVIEMSRFCHVQKSKRASA